MSRMSGWGLSDPVQEAVDRAVELVLETIEELRAQPAPRRRRSDPVHELSLSSAIIATAAKHAEAGA